MLCGPIRGALSQPRRLRYFGFGSYLVALLNCSFFSVSILRPVATDNGRRASYHASANGSAMPTSSPEVAYAIIMHEALQSYGPPNYNRPLKKNRKAVKN